MIGKDEIREILKESPLWRLLSEYEKESVVEDIYNRLKSDPFDVVPHIVQEVLA